MFNADLKTDPNADSEEGSMSKVPMSSQGKYSGIISRVLAPALQLWLRSQTEHIEDLHLNIAAGDRQILSGLIPHVTLQASKAIYQGLHLSQIQLEAETIETNLPQILRRKPLQLLSPIKARGNVQITNTELADSLFPNSLLWQGLTEFLRELIKATGADGDRLFSTTQLQWQSITLGCDRFTIIGVLSQPENQDAMVQIDSGIQAINGHQLRFDPLTIKAPKNLDLGALSHFEIDLGNDVSITQIDITPKQLCCSGQIAIQP